MRRLGEAVHNDHGRPPEALLEEVEDSGEAGMTGEPGGVPPRENLRVNRFRDEKPVGGCLPQTGDGALHLMDPFFHLPRRSSHNAGRGENGPRVRVREVRTTERGRRASHFRTLDGR